MSTVLPLPRRERLEAMEGVHFWSVGRDRLGEELIERFEMAAPVLDAGAGTGAFATRIRQRRSPVHAFDLAAETGADLRASITAMPFASESVGTVLARDVLEHVDDATALAECHRVLRPGGHLLLMVPGWPSLWSPRDELAGHLRRYRRPQLRAVVEAAGFEVLELRGYQFFLLPLLVANRLAAGLLARRTAGPASRLGSSLPGERRLDAEENVPAPIARLFTVVNSLEARLGRSRWLKPPTGSSLCLVARKR